MKKPYLVDARPISHDKNVDEETLLARAEATTAVASVASNGFLGKISKEDTEMRSQVDRNKEVNDCVDDDFRFRGKYACIWAKEKRRRKRCETLHRNKPIAERCRKTCNFENCRTILNSRNKLSVGVYYYPWWAGDFHRGSKPDLYLRRQLEPQQFPMLGEYDDRKPSIIAKHLQWSRQNNIDLWVTSWWGKDRREDLNIKNNILVHPKLGDLNIAIFYETTGRIREKDNYSLENVRPDMEYLCQEYFNHDNYYKMGVDTEGNPDSTSSVRRPVIFVYLTRKLEQLGIFSNVTTLMRDSAKDAGCGEIFIIGDHVFQRPPTTESELIPFDLLDGVTNYDVYGSMRGEKYGGYVGSRENVHQYYEEQNEWRGLAKARNCSFIPAASPGYNDRGVRPEKERVPLSRRINADAGEGSLFRTALEDARTLVDPNIGNLVMINSFNEWHEDTQIEPCIGVNGTRKSTNLPSNLTYGLEYKGYGNLYLKLLRNAARSWDPSMVVQPPLVEDSTEQKGVLSNELLDDNEEDIVTISDTIGWEIN